MGLCSLLLLRNPIWIKLQCLDILVVILAPLSGHLRVDLYDEAFATALVGLVGQQLDIARARFCFNGFIEYNLNILQVSQLPILDFRSVEDYIID